MPEPGGTVTFAVAVANTSVEPVTLISLADDVFGDLLDPANPAVSANTCPAQPRRSRWAGPSPARSTPSWPATPATRTITTR